MTKQPHMLYLATCVGYCKITAVVQTEGRVALYTNSKISNIIIVGASTFTGAYFGQGSGPIHYDHIVCSGMEYNLTDCETGTGTRQSSHDEDVGVKCNTSETPSI